MANYEEYIDKLKIKDEDAFEAVYQGTKNAVYAIIIAIIKDRSMGEDIMQETYLTMLEKINTYQKGRNFTTWLLQIARNKAIDYYRLQKHTQLVDPDLEDITFPCTNATGERSLLISELLDLLNENERSIFLLKIVESLKMREIASILKMPLGTVLWHYNKAVKKIKQIQGGEGSDEE